MYFLNIKNLKTNDVIQEKKPCILYTLYIKWGHQSHLNSLKFKKQPFFSSLGHGKRGAGMEVENTREGVASSIHTP